MTGLLRREFLIGCAAALAALVLTSACQPRSSASAATSPAPATAPVQAPAPATAPPHPVPTQTTRLVPPVELTRPPPPPAAAKPAFSSQVSGVTAAELSRSWRPGCPVPPPQLRSVQLSYVGFDAAVHQGRVIVNADAVLATASVFRALYAAGFPLRSVRPVDEFGGSDDASMSADNTAGFNCRAAVGGSGWSMHAYGRAMDFNPRENPYLEGGQIRPPEGAGYLDRSRFRAGMVAAGGVVVRAFDAVGWGWGGRWASTPDYQHFSVNGQ